MNDKRKELLEENIWKLLFKLSVPSIVGMLVIGLYTFVDAIFVGQWVGENALGAIAVAYPFTLINSGVAVLVGIGSASVLSRAIGKKDQDTVDRIMGNLFTLVLIISLIVTVLGTTFTKNLILLSGAKGEILSLSTSYLKIIFIGSFFVNFAQSANMVMRGEGRMNLAMSIMGVGALLNIILDIVFIKYLNYGVEGAAIATILAQIIQALITYIYFLKVSQYIKIKSYRLDFKIIPDIFAVGISAMLMQVLSLVQQTMMYFVISKVGGQSQIILLGAVMRYLMFSFIPLWGISQGFQPLIGTNYGAQKYDRVKKGTYVFIIASIVVGFLFWIPYMLSTKTILSWFIDNQSIINTGLSNARLAYIIFPIMGVMIILLTFFQAIGDAKKAGITVMLRQFFFFIPILFLLAKTPLKATGVFLAMPVTDTIVLIIVLYMINKVFKNMHIKENITA